LNKILKDVICRVKVQQGESIHTSQLLAPPMKLCEVGEQAIDTDMVIVQVEE
jgi:hypothetical protein